MKILLLILFTLFTVSCMETPEPPAAKEIMAKETIHDNKTEARQAQEAYRKLQERRNNE